jgi:hypothetical protein
MVQTLEIITPDIYFEEDADLSGVEIDPISQLINSHLHATNNISSILFVSSLPDTTYSSVDSISGISQFFIKQNGLTNITPANFERLILEPLNKSFREHGTSTIFESYVSDDLIPSIKLNNPTAVFNTGDTQASTHSYLINNLSWLYFLNTSGDGGLGFDPTGIVKDLIVDKLYHGQPITINDGIKGFEEFMFRNYATCTAWHDKGIMPIDFDPGHAGTYTSGLQGLDKLKTLIDIAYSPLFIDSGDMRVRDAFDDFIQNRNLLSDLVSKGPFYRLLRAFSYLITDVKDQVDTLEILYDIEQCPEEFLPLVAELIGWELFGHDASRWRIQLRNAVSVYKRTGTRESIQIAVNSVFPRDIFNVSSNITELWESYIPNLIYYAIATDSYLFKGFNTWTLQAAKELGVDTYSTTSMDENIRIAVDNIILALVNKFPDSFLLGASSFPVGDPDFIFNYRGRDFPIPPWEEYPYYLRVDLFEKLILKIVDLLVCFGVTETFAIQVGDFIRENTLWATDDIRLDNGWLIFTSGMVLPPNWNEVIRDVTSKRDEFLSLWNGKSSHYKLDFVASSFDFTKSTLEIDAGLAVIESARIADAFAPAHAIRDTRLFLSGQDAYELSSTFPTYDVYDKQDTAEGWESSSVDKKGLARFDSSAHNINGWKRMFQAGTPFDRSQMDTVADPHMLGTSGTENLINVPRNALRRRNYRYAFEAGGFYDRSGDNMPLNWDTSTLERSLPSSLGFLPLGFVPSTCQYVSIPDNNNLPGVYSRCETLSSSSTFNGVDTSNTFPCRGLSALGADLKHTQYLDPHSNYVDRGQLDPFLATIHSIETQRDLMISSNLVSSNFAQYQDYSFGNGIHRLFNDYTKHLKRHTLAKRVILEDGSNIFAHAYGSILQNHDFSSVGELAVATPPFIASSVESAEHAVMYYSANSVGDLLGFAGSATASLASATDAPHDEFRDARIVSGVEYIIQSGTSPLNYIVAYNLKNLGRENYLSYNPVIKIKSFDGFSRLAFDLSSYFGQDNLLIPNHKFKLEVKALIGNERVKRIGGANLGVWIHTAPENGMIWSFRPDKKWVKTNIGDVTRSKIVTELCHPIHFPRGTRDPKTSDNPFNCASSLNPVDNFRNHGLIPTYLENEFETKEILFSTFNKPIKVPQEYFEAHPQVHRSTQNYRVEVFIMPNFANIDKFALIDHINLIDMTQNERTKLFVSGATESDIPFKPWCSSLTVDLNKEQLWTILVQYNGMAGVLASRNKYNSRMASDTSAIMEVSGGSRVSYRTVTGWPSVGTTSTAGGNQLIAVDRYTNIEVVN